MTALSKILLTVAVTGLTGGSVIDLYGNLANPAWSAVLPLGAIAYGLFLIVFMLEKEVAVYDKEQTEKSRGTPRNTVPRKHETDPIQIKTAKPFSPPMT